MTPRVAKGTSTDQLNVTVVRELHPTLTPHPSLYHGERKGGRERGKNNALLSEDPWVFGIQLNEGNAFSA